MSRFLYPVLAAWSLIAPLSLYAQETAPKAPDQAALDKQFEEQMTGVVLVGYFTQTETSTKDLKPERYAITKVSKLKDNFWLFQVRIQYGGKDATLPLPLEVKWAGDTPVITLTDSNVPGFGKFTARVVIYRDHYAGFWAGSGTPHHGGHLFGMIEKDKPAE